MKNYVLHFLFTFLLVHSPLLSALYSYNNPADVNSVTGTAILGEGMRQVFEAEYDTAAPVNCSDEDNPVFFYKSVSRVGEKVLNPSYSNHVYWSVPDGTKGYAYKDLTYRWADDENNYTRIGPEFRFHRFDAFGGNTNNTSCLYIRFVFSVDPVSLDGYASNEPLATFTFKCFDDGFTTNPKSAQFFYGTNTSPVDVLTLTKQQYLSLPAAQDGYADPSIKQMVFRFPLSLPDTDPNFSATLSSQGIVDDIGYYWELKNLSPYIWWHGKGTLRLDFIEFTDDNYKNNTHQPKAGSVGK